MSITLLPWVVLHPVYVTETTKGEKRLTRLLALFLILNLFPLHAEVWLSFPVLQLGALCGPTLPSRRATIRVTEKKGETATEARVYLHSRD